MIETMQHGSPARGRLLTCNRCKTTGNEHAAGWVQSVELAVNGYPLLIVLCDDCDAEKRRAA